MNSTPTVGRYDGFISQVCMTPDQFSLLAREANSVTIAGLLGQKVEEFIQSAMYIPITHDQLILHTFSSSSKRDFRVSGIKFGSCSCYDFYNEKITNGSDIIELGSYVFPLATSFEDYEPYRSLEIYLPFYGYAPLKVADVQGKTLHIYLTIDWMTGAGLYTLEADSLMLSTHECQIGYAVPIATGNASELARNLALSAVKVGAIAGGAYFGGLAGAGVSTSVTNSTSEVAGGGYTKTTQKRNAKTGRLTNRTRVSREDNPTTKTTQSTTVHDTTGSIRGRTINQVFNSAGDAIANFQLRYGGDKTVNTYANFACPNEPFIVERIAKVIPITDDYKSLYGVPYGAVDKLSVASNFTVCHNLHLDNQYFATATASEKVELENLCIEGIILPDVGEVHKVAVNAQNCKYTVSTSKVVDGGDVVITYQANAGYEINMANSYIDGDYANVVRDTVNHNITIYGVSSDITVNIATKLKSFTVTVHNIGCTYTSNTSTVKYGGDVWFKFVANTGYKLPATVGVGGECSRWEWADNLGSLLIQGIKSDISIEITATAIQVQGATWMLNDTLQPDGLPLADWPFALEGELYILDDDTIEQYTGNFWLYTADNYNGVFISISDPTENTASPAVKMLTYYVTDNSGKDVIANDGNYIRAWDDPNGEYFYAPKDNSTDTSTGTYFRKIKITGGADVNDEYLADWLNKNAEKM